VPSHSLSLGAASPASTLGRVDEGRLRAIVEAHFDALWRFLRRLGVAEGDVDDAVQEVILVLTRKLDGIAPGSEKSFVLSTAFRVASDSRRRVKRRREVEPDPLREAVSSGVDPEAQLEKRQLTALFAQVLEQLPLEQRAVFVLYEIEDFTMAEIAQTLQVPAGTVASRLRRGRETFERLASLALAEQERS